MYDGRVVRGNTYAAQLATMRVSSSQLVTVHCRRHTTTNHFVNCSRNPYLIAPPRPSISHSPSQRQQEAVDLEKTRKAEQQQRAVQHEEAYRAATPPPVEGRQHMCVQTDNYLENLVDKPFEASVSCQTETMLDRPMPPIFVPKSSGFDKYTMIEPGDLFDFNIAVTPILEVLVGKTLSQGLTEVCEEEELAALDAQAERWAQQRNAAMAGVQRLEAAEVRRFAEKETRLEEARERRAREAALARKVAARTVAKQYLAGLQEQTLGELEARGHFDDPVLREVETQFMGWLIADVGARLSDVATSRRVVNALIGDAVERVHRSVEVRTATVVMSRHFVFTPCKRHVTPFRVAPERVHNSHSISFIVQCNTGSRRRLRRTRQRMSPPLSRRDWTMRLRRPVCATRRSQSRSGKPREKLRALPLSWPMHRRATKRRVMKKKEKRKTTCRRQLLYLLSISISDSRTRVCLDSDDRGRTWTQVGVRLSISMLRVPSAV
jgi:hypothetical protein